MSGDTIPEPMRRPVRMLGVGALVAVVGVIAAGCGPVVQTTPKPVATGAERNPSLRLLGFHPVTVRGEGFRGGQRLTLVVSSRRTWSRRVLVEPDGSFALSFRGIPLDRCEGFRVRVDDSQGTLARLTSPPFACPPPSPSAT